MRLCSDLWSWINMPPNGLEVEKWTPHIITEKTLFALICLMIMISGSLENRVTISLIFILTGKISLYLKCRKEIGGNENGNLFQTENWRCIFKHQHFPNYWRGSNDIFALTQLNYENCSNIRIIFWSRYLYVGFFNI